MIEDAELFTSWSNLFYKNGAGLVFFLFQAEKPLALGQKGVKITSAVLATCINSNWTDEPCGTVCFGFSVKSLHFERF